jgi:hypothetical protein
MGKDLKRITKWSDKIKFLFKKPGWLPAELGGYQAAPEVNPTTYQKYRTPAPESLNYYVLFQYILCLGGTALFLFNQSKFSMPEKAVITILISLVVVNCGVLFENRKWVRSAEWIRIVLYPIILGALTLLNGWPLAYLGISIAYLFISTIWFYSLTKNAQLQTA